MLDVLQILDTFAANVDYDITVYRLGMPESSTITARRWESEESPWAGLAQAISNSDVGEGISITEIAENIRGILVPSRVPFEQYDFSKRLRGRAWFWLLKGREGMPCARRGYLSISNTISLVGPPALAGIIGHARRVELSSRQWKSFLKMLRAKAERGESLKGDSKTLRAVRSVARHIEDRFEREWDNLNIEQRRTVCESLESMSDDSKYWFVAPGIPEELLQEDHEWSNRPLMFGYPLRFNDVPRALALHGIRLPAGFVEWDPMAGSARQIILLENMLSGILVDMRGLGAPTPAANRLFVLTDEAKKEALPLLRACLRHAVQLASGRPEEEGWGAWLSYFLSTLTDNYYWQELLNYEYDIMEPHMTHRVAVSGVESDLTWQQLVEIFGEWAPLRSYWQDSPRDGIIIYGNEAISLVFRERRARGDGMLEVNLMSKVEVPPEKMREEVGRFTAELESVGIFLLDE